LQLLKLIEEAKAAFRAAKLNYSHAFEIARLQPLCGVCENEALGVKSFYF
jgi:hypothetical protein